MAKRFDKEIMEHEQPLEIPSVIKDTLSQAMPEGAFPLKSVLHSGLSLKMLK